MSLVVDASALVFSLLGGTTAAAALRRRLVDGRCHAPHLVDAELGNVLRRRVLRGELAEPHARVLLADGATLVDDRYEQRGALAEAAWTIRNRVGFYDGLYVALAASLDLPLVTVDARLARAGPIPCRVELVGARVG